MSDNKSPPASNQSSLAFQLSYRDAGVDIDAGDALVEAIKPYAKKTMRPEVLTGIGGFGALVEVSKKYRNPVLVSGTDGVGTKLKLAFELQRHDSIGIDLVAMSANDILVQGAEPIFFLDYFACGKLDVGVATEVIKGIARGCELAGCALIGGETAEMPGMYPPNEYDLAGFAVGIVEKDAIIDGHGVVSGDALIGVASSGAHSNGYSLIRKILQRAQADLTAPLNDRTLADVLMEPTRIYVKTVHSLLPQVRIKAMAHITGGGLVGNIGRSLPDHVVAVVDRKSWPRPPLFQWLQREGSVPEEEMVRVFNCGVGFVIVVAREQAARTAEILRLRGETAWQIGVIRARAEGEPKVVVT